MEKKPVRVCAQAGVCPPRICTIDAPCKINLHLSIGERRPDGFHSLESIFATLALSDTLRFECVGNGGESVLSINHEISHEPSGDDEADGQIIPQEENLVLKAVSLFREWTGFSSALDIRLDKRIPVGAGLGGGSSDAASTLLALNLLAGQALPMEKLSEMAAILGSDVPFFLYQGAAFVSGRGERVEPVRSPEGLWVILVKPPFFSDTTCAYGLLDEVREGRAAGNLLADKLSKETLVWALENDPGTWPFYNDFLPVFLSFAPLRNDRRGANAGIYRAILEDLRKAGASFAGLSGAGSCCFGVFGTEEMAKIAEKELSRGKNHINLTFFLAQKANAILEY